MNKEEIIPGAKVHYSPDHGLKENGMVKRITDDGEGAFVVYNCAGEWDRYEDFTAANTPLAYLKPGWVDDARNKHFC